MEHHRLKSMPPNYDENLFTELYQRTIPLRKKLAFEIDARKFGVDYLEILSWFDVKFIHAFNKYYSKKYWNGNPGRLLGYIINALSIYKYRIMRSSYQIKFHSHAHMLDITEYYGKIDVEDESPSIEKDKYLDDIMGFMKSKLNHDAMFILEIELNPPVFILEQLKDLGKNGNSKIPNQVIADYLGYPNSHKLINYISDLRKDIKLATELAKIHFK